MNIVDEAKQLVSQSRRNNYGHPTDDFSRTAKIWSAILGIRVTPVQVGLCMIGVKLSRETNKHTVDNLVDISGYALCVQEIAESNRVSGMIYLACPYSHENKQIELERFKIVTKVATKLTEQGIIVFSPITHSHPMAIEGLHADWIFWEKYDIFFLDRASALYVLTLDGWKDSVGVQAEMAYAEKIGIPIKFIGENDYEK